MLKKYWSKIYIFLCFAVLALFSTDRIVQTNTDIWYLLRTGEFIWQQKHLMWQDIFSWTAQGHENSMHEWLSAVIFYLIQHFFGFFGLSMLIVILGVLILYSVYCIFRLFDLSRYWIGIILLVTLSMFMSWLPARPQVFTFLFLTITFFLLERFFILVKKPEFAQKTIRQKFRQAFLFIPLLFLIWANLHAGILAGISLLLLYFVYEMGKYLIYNKQNRSLSANDLVALFLTIPGALIFSLCNPNFYHIYTYIFAIDPAKANKYVLEWTPLFAGILGNDLKLFLLISLALIVFLLILFFAGKVETRDIFIVLVFAVLAVTNIRHILLFSIVITIFVGKGLAGLIRTKKINHNEHKIIFSISSITLVFLVLIMFLTKNIGYGVDWYSFPNQAANFVLEHRIKGKMYNDYDHGGFLIWKLYPENKVFLDGRFDLYLDNGVFEDYYNISSNKMTEIITKYDFDFFITPNWKSFLSSDTNKLLLTERLLTEYHDQYALVYYDDNAFIFVRRNEEFQKIIAENALEEVYPNRNHPYRNSGNGDLKEKTEKAIIEYLRLINANPAGVEPHLNLATIYLETGQNREAILHLEQAIKNYPPYLVSHPKALERISLAEAHYKKANAYANLEEWEQAVMELEIVIRYDAKYSQAYRNLGGIYDSYLHDSKKAKQYLKKYLELNPTESNQTILQLVNN